MTTTEVSEHLNVSSRMVRFWVKSGKLKTADNGHHHRFDPEHVRAFRAARMLTKDEQCYVRFAQEEDIEDE